MTEQRDSSGSAFLRTVGTILRVLVRLVFVIVIGALIGVGLFYGVPWAYRRLVWPIYENSAQITVLQEQVEKNSENIFGNHRALQSRIGDLETEVTQLRETTAAQAQNQEILIEEGQQLSQLISALEGDLETQLETQQQDIEQIRSDIAETTSDLEGEIEEVQAQFAEAQARLDETQEDLTQQIEVSEGSLSALEGQLEEAMARLALLQTAQDLLKVRLLLVEENPGAARDVLDLAVAHLDTADELMPLQGDVLDDLRERLLAVDDLIAERSFRARPSLESLWADIMDLVTPLTAQSTVTETQMTTPLPTPTPSP